MNNLAIPFVDLPNPLAQGMEYLRDKTFDGLSYMLTATEGFLVNPPRPDFSNGWVQYFFANSWGIAQLISTLVMMVFGFTVMLMRTHGKQALQALGIAVVVGAGGGLFYIAAYYLTLLGDQLAKLALFYTASSTDPMRSGPVWDNPVLATLLFGLACLLALVLAIETAAFVFIGLFVQMLGIVSLSVRMLGRFGQKMWVWVISLGIVSVVFGRAISVFCIELGEKWRYGLPPSIGSPVFAILIMAFSLGMAIGLPILMVLASNFVIVKLQSGRSNATVDGNVDTKDMSPERQRVEVADADAAHARSMMDDDTSSPISTPVSETPVVTPPEDKKQEVAKQVVSAAVKGAAAKATVSAAGGPAGTAVVAAQVAHDVVQATRKD